MTIASMKKVFVLSVAMTWSFYAGAASYTFRETPNYSDVQRAGQELVSRFGGQQVLVVLDLDNTTLRTPSDIASEHWFLWQTSLLQNGEKHLPLVAPTIDGILAAQNAMIAVSPMDLVSPEIASSIAAIRRTGAAVIVLTSRSEAQHDQAIRELRRNKVYLSSKEELKLPELDGLFLPYDVNHLERIGLKQDDASRLGISAAKPALFDQGVFFTNGQHKGVMMKVLMAMSRRKFSAVLFVDDRLKHHTSVKDVFAEGPMTLTSVRYTKMSGVIDAFNNGSKDRVERQWCSFADGMKGSVLSTARTLPFTACH